VNIAYPIERSRARRLLLLFGYTNGWARWFGKQGPEVLEQAAALGFLLLSAPILGLAALLIKLTSRGPALYRQVRLGRHGKHFTLYKLRSMRHECEADSGPCWSLPGDSRVTSIGWWLRRFHIDELPQLWNVLRGDMSFIGPRPERPEIAVRLQEALPQFKDRLRVKPGLTGLAQVLLPPDVSVNTVRNKLAYDLYFIRQGGWELRGKILLGTLLHLTRFPPDTAGRWLNLPQFSIMV
jgi:lipopolysaccharide/colanic/teichoic acid biosynthesis glycosyltransferase